MAFSQFVPVAFGLRPPDFGETLSRIEAINSARLAQAWARRDEERERTLASLLTQHGGALTGADPAARRAAVSNLLAAGVPGVQVAAPFISALLAEDAQRQVPLTPEERRGMGLPAGVVATRDAMGRVNVVYRPPEYGPESFGAPMVMADPETGQPIVVQFGNRGGVRRVQGVAPPAEAQPAMPGNNERANALNTMVNLAPRILSGQATWQDVAAFQAAGEIWQAPRFDPSTGQYVQGLALPEPIQRAFDALRSAAMPPSSGAAGEDGGRAPPRERTNTGAVRELPAEERPLTEAQARANLFGTQMEMANRILETVRTPSGWTTAAWRNLPEGVVNPALPTEAQQYFNALRIFAAGVLRKETGAAFTADELRDVQTRYFPMPGDSTDVIAQKARAREAAINAMRAEMPGRRFRYGEGGLGAPPASAIPGPTQGSTAEPPPRAREERVLRFNPRTGRLEEVRE